MAKNSGTLVISAIRPYDDTDTYATAYASEIRGGHHQVQDDTERDNIYTERKQEGMFVTVLSSASNGGEMTTYMLSGGTWTIANTTLLSSLEDVSLSSIQNDEVLIYSGGNWINYNLSNRYLEKNGDIATGILSYSSSFTFTNDNEIINKKYVDDVISASGGTFVTNPSDNRVLTSDGTTKGIDAESNLTFDGSLLNIIGGIKLSDYTSAASQGMVRYNSGRIQGYNTTGWVNLDKSDEEIQATVGSILDDGTIGNIVFNYDGVNDTISATVEENEINHNNLLNYIVNEHIDHSTVSISTSGILSGGGDLTTGRTISLNNSDIDHDQLLNFVANEHIDHSTISILTDGILSGGGDLTSNRTISLYNTDIDHDQLLNFVANEHIDWTIDQGATNVHINNIPSLSSTDLSDMPSGLTADKWLKVDSTGSFYELTNSPLYNEGTNINIDGTNTISVVDSPSFAGNLNASNIQYNTSRNSTTLGISTGSLGTYNNQTMIGHYAGNSTTTEDVVFIGDFAGYGSTANNDVVAIGSHAGDSSDGIYSVYIGGYSGYQATGNYSTFIGIYAGYGNLQQDSVGVGYNAGFNNKGYRSTYIGSRAGYSNDGNYALFSGYSAGYNSDGSYNLGYGYQAFQNGSGQFNISIGRDAGSSNTGNNNVFIGYNAGLNNTLDNKFILKQESANTIPLIEGDFSTGEIKISGTTNSLAYQVAGVDLASIHLSDMPTGLTADKWLKVDSTGSFYELIDAPSGGTSLGGTDGQMQYNNNGVLGGTDLFYDDSLNTFAARKTGMVNTINAIDDVLFNIPLDRYGSEGYKEFVRFTDTSTSETVGKIYYDSASMRMDLNYITIVENTYDGIVFKDSGGSGTNIFDFANVHTSPRKLDVGNIAHLSNGLDVVQIYSDLKIGSDTNGYTLPNSDGNTDQILKTDGSGSVYWADESTTSSTFIGLSDTPTGYTADQWLKVNSTGDAVEFVSTPTTPPGGTDGQIQYNNNDSFGGTGLVYDDSTSTFKWGSSSADSLTNFTINSKGDSYTDGVFFDLKEEYGTSVIKIKDQGGIGNVYTNSITSLKYGNENTYELNLYGSKVIIHDTMSIYDRSTFPSSPIEGDTIRMLNTSNSPDGIYTYMNGQWVDNIGKKDVTMVVFTSTESVTVGNGVIPVFISEELNGYRLYDVIVGCSTTSTSNTTDIQIRRVRSGSAVDMLSTKVTLGVGEYFINDGVINTSNDDIQKGDAIFADIDTVGTGVQGLYITLTFVY